MNQGERDELILKIKLIELRDAGLSVPPLGTISTVGMTHQYLEIPQGIAMAKITQLSDGELSRLAESCGISKAKTSHKADTIVNGIPFSLKSIRSAPPALVNHTTRPGFVNAGIHGGGDIELLDTLIDQYWALRLERKIGEDIGNYDIRSPFREHKEIVRPFLNYFLFRGSGSRLSSLAADKILSFSDPLDPTTWRVHDQTNAIDIYWDNLVFSLRAKKGMPSGYPNSLSRKHQVVKESIDKWTRFVDNDFRGALHIRSKY